MFIALYHFMAGAYQLFAASNIGIFFYQIILVIGVLYFLVHICSHNSSQRIMNLLSGVIGCAISFLAYVQLDDIPKYKWLVEGIYFLLMPPVVMTIGGVAGIVLLILIRWISRRFLHIYLYIIHKCK
jgi:hypothetical protein